MAAPEADVVLYGGSGYTGRLIAQELDRLGASFIVAGRDRARLEALAATLPSKPPVAAVPLADRAGLVRLASRARALVSAAGPFVEAGPPVVDACIEAGTHFCDITGEQGYLRWCLDHDQRARDADVAVVNALGFDVVPSDLAAVLACRGLPRVDRLDLVVHVANTMVSRGTRRSMASSAGRRWWYDRGRYRSGPPGRFLERFRFPDPVGQQWGVFIPWGDCVTAPRSTGARTVRTFFTTNEAQAKRFHRYWMLTDVMTRTSWFQRRLAAKAERAREGPTLEQRDAAAFMALGLATGPDGAIQRAVVEGKDPYGLTGRAAALAGLKLARGGVGARGVLTPSQAFDLEGLAKELQPFVSGWRVPG